MPSDLFQIGCVAILAVAYALTLWRASNRRDLVQTILLLALSAYLAEQTSISRYHFYGYADGWWLRAGDVPLLIPLIWPMVVLSARQVVTALWPNASRRARTARVAVAVAIDASMMEIIAVAAGLWHWSEPGYFDVPLIGILGWVCFAAAASWWLDDVAARGARSRIWALPVVTVAATHVMLVLLWWGGLRWGLRHDLGDLAVIAFGVLMIPVVIAVARARARGRRIGWDANTPRLVAASIFFVVLAGLPWDQAQWLWIHTALVAAPYLVGMELGRRRAGDARPV